jgi:hypothetical protein
VVSGWFEEREELLTSGMRERCYGAFLSEAGWEAFDRLMPEALEHHNDDWLVREMAPAHYWRASYPKRRRGGGGYTTARINPGWASRMLSLTEFNTAYVRGLARSLVRRGVSECIVYRAGPAAEPRTDCSSWEGRRFELQQVLDGHRARYFPPPGNPVAFSVPTGPNCHHSIKSVSEHDDHWALRP